MSHGVDRDEFFKMGELLAGIQFNEPYERTEQRKVAGHYYVEDDTAYNQYAANIIDSVGEAMCRSGNTDNALYPLLQKIASSEEWHPQFNDLADYLMESIQKSKRVCDEFEVITKTARWNPLTWMAGTGTRGGVDMLKLMAVLGIGGAGLTGAAYWGANRELDQDDKEAEVRKQNIREYDVLTRDLNKALLRRDPNYTI